MKLFCKHDFEHIIQNREIDVYSDIYPSNRPEYTKMLNLWVCKKCGKSIKKVVNI